MQKFAERLAKTAIEDLQLQMGRPTAFFADFFN